MSLSSSFNTWVALSWAKMVVAVVVTWTCVEPATCKRDAEGAAAGIHDDYMPGMRCSAERIAGILRAKPHRNSNCPVTQAWVDVLLDETADMPSATVVSIGCNKGDDFIFQMRDWSGNSTYAPMVYKALAESIFNDSLTSPRSCTLRADTVREFPYHARPTRGYCIEPLPRTFIFLEACMQELQYLGPVKLVEAAMSSVHGTALFPDAEAGRECFGLDFDPENNPYGTVEVEVKTLDSLMRSESIETIDFLSIDAEGHDVRVLLGALHTLAAHKIRYFEFEYSEHGKWATSDLEDVIDMLDHFGYDCYWALNSGGLSRLTGCWHPTYAAEAFWSNIACISRRQSRTHARMQEIADVSHDGIVSR